MTPKNRIIEGKNRGEGGSKMTQKNRTSFMHDPLSKNLCQNLSKSVKRFLCNLRNREAILNIGRNSV